MAGGYYSKNVSPLEGNKGALEFPANPKKKVQPAVIDVAKFGRLKRALQPWTFRIYASVKNKTKEPRRVGVVLEDCPLPVRWHVTDYTWDETVRAIREPLPPGKGFGVYLFADVPEEMRRRPVICDGRLQALDAETGAVLAALPLRIVNSAAGAGAGGGSGSRGTERGARPADVPDGAMHSPPVNSH